MFKKQLIPLVIILAILAAVLVLKQWRQTPTSLEEQLELKALAPSDFLVSAAVRVEIYRGSKENEKVVLARKDDQWYVESKFNSPGKKEAIEGLLDKMKSLEGEFRSEDVAVISDYDLGEDKALHVVVRRKDEEKAGYHLIVGKKETYGRSFVRRSGENTVYTINVNLASEIGIWGEGDNAPEAGKWLNKTIVDLDKEKIVRIALKTPDRFCVFEKREEKKEEDTEKKEGEAEKDTEIKKQLKWTLAEGGLDGTFKQSGVNAILQSIDSMSATDVENPDKKNELGLENPGYRCEVDAEDGEKTVLVGAHGEQNDNAYVMVEGRETVYKLSARSFKRLFKDGKDLFALKGLSEKADKVNQITLKYPSAKIRLVREEKKDKKEWTISSPQTGLAFKESKGTDIAKALASWSPADYADGTGLKALGLARPEMTAIFTTEDGKRHMIAVGAQAKGVEGRYALLDGDKRVWVASSSDVKKIFPDLDGLFELEVADIASKDITRVQVEREDAGFVLKRKGKDEWVLTAGKKKIEVDKSKVHEFLKRFSPVTASDLALGQSSLMKNIKSKVSVDTKKKHLVIQFGVEKDGSRAARVSGKSAILLFSKSVADGLVPPLKDLEKSENPPHPPFDKGGKAEEAKSEKAKPKEAKPEKAKPKEAKPEKAKPKEAKPEEAKPKEAKPKEAKPEEAKPEKLTR